MSTNESGRPCGRPLRFVPFVLVLRQSSRRLSVSFEFWTWSIRT